MSERLCGYCRNPGHMKPSCPLFREERMLILKHTPIQRKLLIHSLAKAGMGNGAMVAGTDFWGKDFIGIMQDFDWVGSANFMDYRNLKYSKKVRLTSLHIEKDYTYRRIHVKIISMADGVTTMSNLPVYATKLYEGLSPTHFFDCQVQIITPSYDADYDESILTKSVLMPDRLKLSNELGYMTGIMPP